LFIGRPESRDGGRRGDGALLGEVTAFRRARDGHRRSGRAGFATSGNEQSVRIFESEDVSPVLG